MRQIDFQVYKLQTWEWCSFFGFMDRYCRTIMINDSPLDRLLMPSCKVELGLRVTHYISIVINVRYVNTLSVHNRTSDSAECFHSGAKRSLPKLLSAG